MEIFFDLLEEPGRNLDDRVKETLVKFLRFVPQLIKHGNHANCYNKENLSQDIYNYEVSDASSFNFEFCCADDLMFIDRQKYRQILQNTNFINILSFCFNMLLKYVNYCIENADEADYEFLLIVINVIIRTYGILLINSDWLQLIEISNMVEKFLKFLIGMLSNLDTPRLKEKHGVHLLNMKLLLLFKKDANCRNTVINFIDKELIRYLYNYQNEIDQDCITLENVINMLIVLKVMLECKFNPKEEILRTIITNLNVQTSRKSNSSGHDLTQMLQILSKYLPKYTQVVVEDCINTIQLENSITYHS